MVVLLAALLVSDDVLLRLKLNEGAVLTYERTLDFESQADHSHFVFVDKLIGTYDKPGLNPGEMVFLWQTVPVKIIMEGETIPAEDVKSEHRTPEVRGVTGVISERGEDISDALFFRKIAVLSSPVFPANKVPLGHKWTMPYEDKILSSINATFHYTLEKLKPMTISFDYAEVNEPRMLAKGTYEIDPANGILRTMSATVSGIPMIPGGEPEEQKLTLKLNLLSISKRKSAKT